jgi:metal-responsive CopG/Arc/MetJ family transcriptional regulator
VSIVVQNDSELVDIIISNIPRNKLNKFDKKVVEPHFPGGRSEAIRALISQSIAKQRQ